MSFFGFGKKENKEKKDKKDTFIDVNNSAHFNKTQWSYDESSDVISHNTGGWQSVYGKTSIVLPNKTHRRIIWEIKLAFTSSMNLMIGSLFSNIHFLKFLFFCVCVFFLYNFLNIYLKTIKHKIKCFKFSKHFPRIL